MTAGSGGVGKVWAPAVAPASAVARTGDMNIDMNVRTVKANAGKASADLTRMRFTRTP
ncbi:hypothetical protein Psi02_11690 [Planotetraspora silvatica]|uniref:Uncharacterized protein n=1 Tax=Planotetraspora silvatica TaxID=234614 RepID=A0A8J3UUE1_9ACTN|nr:hypothetical protein Psi02_11690 [Planotetraspora silvatica]